MGSSESGSVGNTQALRDGHFFEFLLDTYDRTSTKH